MGERRRKRRRRLSSHSWPSPLGCQGEREREGFLLPFFPSSPAILPGHSCLCSCAISHYWRCERGGKGRRRRGLKLFRFLNAGATGITVSRADRDKRREDFPVLVASACVCVCVFPLLLLATFTCFPPSLTYW